MLGFSKTGVLLHSASYFENKRMATKSYFFDFYFYFFEKKG